MTNRKSKESSTILSSLQEKREFVRYAPQAIMELSIIGDSPESEGRGDQNQRIGEEWDGPRTLHKTKHDQPKIILLGRNKTRVENQQFSFDIK